MDNAQKKSNERFRRISELRNVICSCIEKNISIDYNKLVFEVCSKYFCSRRTAVEYIMQILSEKNLAVVNDVITKKSQPAQGSLFP